MSCVRIELLRTIFLLISVGFSGGIEDKRPAASWSTVSEDRMAASSSSFDGLVVEGSPTGPPTVSTTGSLRIGSEKRVCQGTVSGLGHTDDQNERYELYRSLYTECTHVNGNLEIVFLSNYSLDLSFLRSIREISGYVLIVANYLSYIPLSNLRIVRGRNLFEYEGRRFSLYVALNYDRLRPDIGLKELRFTSLHEIMAGSVFIYDNPNLCFHDTIVWEDILSGEGANFTFDRSSELEKLNVSTTCGKCHGSCKSGCWGSGPEHCQELTRVSCSPQCDGHCFGQLPNQCCHPECAGGCTGPSTSQCWSCKNFDNGGVCANVCPPLEIYSSHEFRMVPNQEFKYAYGSLCVDKCPAHLIADKASCVQDCGAGKMAGKDGKCLECDGPCPKTCQINMENSEFINSKNIAEYAGCTIIQGSIKILDATFAEDKYFGRVALRPHQLSVLESIQEVTDFVQIQANHPNFRNLNFLKNLRIIHGRKLDRLRTRTSLQIFKTSLESLGLDSLEEIRFGHVHISNNSRLCYARAINWTRLRAKSEQKAVIEFNRDSASCAQDSEVCAPECTDDGCWGPLDTQCVLCRNFHLGKRCIKDCASTPGIFQSGDKECQKCNVQCMTDCYGPGPDRCDGCRNVKDGPYCADRCPETKYADEGSVCQPCHPNCDSGCTGPKNAVALGGCNSCSLVVYGDNGQDVAECLRVNSQCPDGYYRQKIINDTNFRSLNGKQGCMKCHAQCTTCIGYGAAFCLSCRHYRQEGECVPKCRTEYFVDQESNECIRCDPQCLGCHGPTAANCAKCKLYKFYSDSNFFNCTDTCPDFAPYKHLDEASKETICVSENNEAIHRQWMIISITVVVVGIVMIILIISLILCNQRNKAWKSAQKLTERMHQPYEAEPLKPTNAKPDMAKMRIVSESELQWGSYIIGSGAFGTVFKGVWIPVGQVPVQVAIKVLQKSSSGQSKEFLDEARIMCSVDHPCCVRILGICLSARMMLVTQLMPLGCLLEFIRRNADRVGSAMLLNWCKQIAEGMNHLESHGIVHCDLAARNVLVESTEQVKITDFGLAKMLELGHKEFQAERGKMPIKWLAIESITTRIFTHKSDVWSFGVTLWEIFTFGKRPYENVPVIEIPVLLEKGERLLQPNACSIELYMLMTKCWMSDADKRPKFEVLVNALSEMASNPLRYLRIASDDQAHSSEPVSRNSDDYDTHFGQYIEPVRKGPNLSVRYIQQPSTNENRVVPGKSNLWSSRISDCVKSLDSIEEYEIMSPASLTSNGSIQISDDLPQYINIVDSSSDSEESSDADDFSIGMMDPDPLLSMLKDRAIANPEYFDAFVDAPVKSALRCPGQRDARTVHLHRSRIDSVGFTEESSRSSTEGSEHDYYNFYNAPLSGLHLC